MITAEIPEAITTAASSMLAPYCPGLTPDELTKRLATVPETERMLTRKEAAHRLSVSTVTLDRMIKAGELEARRIRGSVRIPASAVAAIVNGEAA